VINVIHAPSSRWSERWRVLAYSAAAALAFIGLERLELAAFDAAGPDRLFARTRSAAADERLAGEAADIAARSRSPAAALPAGHRLATFRLGYEVGWASEFAGSFAMSDPAVRAKAATVADARIAVAREQAVALGIDPAAVAALPSRTLADFTRLQERFEADESGLAARVESRLTPLHRHLFLLGVDIGSDAERVQSSRGEFADPQVEAIRRHATLAGVAAEVWQPLVVDRGDASPAARIERHRAAVEQLARALATSDADDVQRPPPSR